jgi:hypothetical protein
MSIRITLCFCLVIVSTATAFGETFGIVTYVYDGDTILWKAYLGLSVCQTWVVLEGAEQGHHQTKGVLGAVHSAVAVTG